MKFGKMKTHRRNRLLIVGALLLSAGGFVSFALLALDENMNLFYSPEQIAQGEAPEDVLIRAGGMVLANTVERSKTDLTVTFVIGDMKESEVTVEYQGILPDLFREGQGVIAKGKLDNRGVFLAEEVLAKHDEEYMPPEVAEILADAHEDNPAFETTM